METSSFSCSAKPTRRTRTVAELCLWLVLWSELQKTFSTGLLQLMVSANANMMEKFWS